MKYIEEFRDGKAARAVANRIRAEVQPDREYNLMEFCGGHTHAIYRYGILNLLPKNIHMIHGPGCPVCVLPIARIDNAIYLAQQPNVILCSYADMMRVPGSNRRSLLKAKAEGADVRMIYSVDDALRIAREHPDKEVIFFAIGFETTTPPTVVAIQTAKQQGLKNFSVFCNHVLTPVPMEALLSAEEGVVIHGFVGPAHVSVVIGMKGYAHIPERYGTPIVISGFEPLDVIQSILMLVRLINAGKNNIENEYTRAVTMEGNTKSQAWMKEILEVRDTFEWRGLGFIPKSALKIRVAYSDFDAEVRYTIPESEGQEHRACECGAILRGVKRPTDCKLFAKACTPENPLGSCMVSSEGACAAHYAYGRAE